MNRHDQHESEWRRMSSQPGVGRRMATAVGIAAGSAVGLAMLAGSALPLLSTGVSTPDAAVAAAMQVVGAAMLAWYLVTSLVAIACLAARGAGRVWTAGERRLSALGAPLARRLLVGGTGAVVAAAAVLTPAVAAPASIAPAVAGPVTTLSDDLGWGAGEDGGAEDEPTADDGAEEPEPSAEGPEPEPEPAEPVPPAPQPAEPASASDTDEATYTVAAGDSLWAIAADHLPEGASPADIAAEWPEWFEENRDVIGTDPDLIHPGQVLLVPDHDPEEEA